MELAKSLSFVKKIEEIAIEKSPTKNQRKEKQPYNPEFLKKIEESRQQAREGKVTRLKKEDFSTYLGL